MSKAAIAADFEIVPIEQVAREDVLAILDQSFGPGHNDAWFTWKHLDNPYGRSSGWVAIGVRGLLGVRLFMRWQLQGGAREVRAVRPVDTATAPQARGRGVFRELTRFAVEEVMRDSRADIIFNTPNLNSRIAYSRMGWTLLPPIAHGYRPVLPGRAAKLESDDAAFEAFDHFYPNGDRLRSHRSSKVMRWRYDARSGVSYSISRLRQAEAPNAIIYRMTERWGMRVLVVNELAGNPDEKRVLAQSAARSEGARALLFATGDGALNSVEGAAIRRGNSVLAVRALKNIEPAPADLNSWALTLGDLERVI